MQCEECGTDLPEGALFCAECGARAERGSRFAEPGLPDFDMDYIGVTASAAEDMPVLHLSEPNSTVVPPSGPAEPVLERSVVAGIAIIATAFAIIAIVVLGWIVVPAMLEAAGGAA